MVQTKKIGLSKNIPLRAKHFFAILYAVTFVPVAQSRKERGISPKVHFIELKPCP